MIIYIITFLVVIVLSKLIERYKKSKISYFIAIVLLLILSIVAGIRSVDMGWDASKYVVSTFYRLDYYNGLIEPFMNETTVEMGFSIYSWFLYKLYPNINFLMFGYSFITTFFIMIFAFREQNKISISKVLIIYYLTLYLVSYNIIRQSISVAIVLVSISLFKDKKKIKALMLFIISLLFHDSAILAIPIYILYIILNKSSSNNIKLRRAIIILIVTLIVSYCYSYIIQMLYNIGLITQKYYNYFLSYDDIDYNLSNIFINIYWLIFSCVFIKMDTEKNKFNELIFNIVLFSISLVINVVSIKIHPIYRISYYYYYIGLFNFVPRFNSYIRNDKANRKVGNLLVYGFLLLMFLWMTVLGNGHNIYPYHSDIYIWL